MKKLILIAAVLAATGGSASAQSQEDQAACTPDVMRLCQQDIPDKGRIVACLIRSRVQLSPACTEVFSRARSAGLVKAKLWPAVFWRRIDFRRAERGTLTASDPSKIVRAIMPVTEDNTMKAFFAVTLAATFTLVPLAALAQDRPADAAMGAGAGFLVGGPVGAVVGGVVGYTAGPNIAQGMGMHRRDGYYDNYGHHHYTRHIDAERSADSPR
jgi:hypothetical protein